MQEDLQALLQRLIQGNPLLLKLDEEFGMILTYVLVLCALQDIPAYRLQWKGRWLLIDLLLEVLTLLLYAKPNRKNGDRKGWQREKGKRQSNGKKNRWNRGTNWRRKK